MMKKSQIDFCDFTWNPVTGCRYTCEYCYARKLARRFSGDARLNKSSSQLKYDAETKTFTLPAPFKNDAGNVSLFPAGFEPTLHEYRLEMIAQKKKPAHILVCSTADLFGEWVPTEWITRVFDACKAAPWHNYLFLTKNPQRYCELANAGILPKEKNFWYGTSVTTKVAPFFDAEGYNTFVCIEPLHADVGSNVGNFGGSRWIIVGAETGESRKKIKPEREWIENIIETAALTRAAVLLKDSAEMREVWGDDLIQEFPPELQRPEEGPLPRCESCEHCNIIVQGKRGKNRWCTIGWKEEPERTAPGEARHIPGHYAKQSPLWCPLRIGSQRRGAATELLSASGVEPKWEHHAEQMQKYPAKRDNRDNRGTENQRKPSGAKNPRQSGNNFEVVKNPVFMRVCGSSKHNLIAK